MKPARIYKIIVIMLLAAIVCVGAAGCGNGDDRNDVVKVQIVSGSFKETYQLDEAINYDKIFIVATYANGDRNQIKVEKNWISGLDVATTGSNRTLTVTYGGASANYIYSVIYKATVSTPVRLVATATEEKGKKSVDIGLNSVESMPVYAAKVEIFLSDATYVGKEDSFPETWAVAVNEEAGKVGFLFYSKNGNDALIAGDKLAKLIFGGDSQSIRIELTVGDGIEERRAPDLIVNLKNI